MRFMIFDTTDFARLSMPPFFFLPRRRFDFPLLSGGGDNNSPMSPNGLPPPLLPLLPVKRELSSDDEKSLDPAPIEGGINALLECPPNSPSKNGLFPIPMGDDNSLLLAPPPLLVPLPSLISLP